MQYLYRFAFPAVICIEFNTGINLCNSFSLLIGVAFWVVQDKYNCVVWLFNHYWRNDIQIKSNALIFSRFLRSKIKIIIDIIWQRHACFWRVAMENSYDNGWTSRQKKEKDKAFCGVSASAVYYMNFLNFWHIDTFFDVFDAWCTLLLAYCISAISIKYKPQNVL